MVSALLVRKERKMENFEVYLAGRIANLSYEEAMKLRDDVVKKFESVGIKCRTPMRGKQHLKDGSKINGTVRDIMTLLLRIFGALPKRFAGSVGGAFSRTVGTHLAATATLTSRF